jgi:hypothetical protein
MSRSQSSNCDIKAVVSICFVGLSFALRMAMGADPAAPAQGSVRFATFNIEVLSAEKLRSVDAAGRGNHVQLCRAAEILQRIRPDVLLVNEIDYDGPAEDGPTASASGNPVQSGAPNSATRFRDLYLQVSQNGQKPLDYPHLFYGPSNTGIPTGKDLNNDGKTDGPADAYGYGAYPGQYGMVLYSRFPISAAAARTFRKFRWTDMPGNLMPDGKDGKPGFYSPDEVALFRLSSKSHWDVPVQIGQSVVHVLASHPTPPIFDGPEDSNGRRNFDEIRLWADYISGGDRAAYITDDCGRIGGLLPRADFVVMGDLNADPVRNEQPYGKAAVRQLLDLPTVQDPKPRSTGSALARHDVELEDYLPYRTSNFGRIDYCLPSRGLKVAGSGVFWPEPGDPLHHLIDPPDPASDHFAVWTDLVLPGT